jgi:hypothetical protein
MQITGLMNRFLNLLPWLPLFLKFGLSSCKTENIKLQFEISADGLAQILISTHPSGLSLGNLAEIVLLKDLQFKVLGIINSGAFPNSPHES